MIIIKVLKQQIVLYENKKDVYGSLKEIIIDRPTNRPTNQPPDGHGGS